MDETNVNYLQLRNCPQNPFIDWRIEDVDGVCAKTKDGELDWEIQWSNGVGLGSFLYGCPGSYWIRPSKSAINGCGLATTSSSWADTTTVKAHNSNGAITVFYSGR